MRNEGSQLTLLVATLSSSKNPPAEDVETIKELAGVLKTLHEAGAWRTEPKVKEELKGAMRLVLQKAKLGGPTVLKALKGWNGIVFD